MRKTPSLFQRNYDGDKLVRDEPVPGSEWVAAGEGVATRKWDGTCCLVRDGKLYKRYDAKRGKTPPPNFEEAMEADPVTGHRTGWIPVGDEPESEWHREAWAAQPGLEDGTYELCGPRLQGNPERLAAHQFIRHGAEVLEDCPRTFDALKAYLAERDIEGVVWHHPDGRFVKIKTGDFGIKRSATAARPGYVLSGLSDHTLRFLRRCEVIRKDGSFDVVNACVAFDTLIVDGFRHV